MGENDEYQIEMRIEQEDMYELMQLKKGGIPSEVKTVPHSLVSDIEDDTRRKISISQTTESLATKNIERKIDEKDLRQIKSFNKFDPLNVEEDF
ncbi:hypothetical protein AVEN_230132-1 [Araneus ventricosus]|uniref:Uncharacterized protein n=1 Tax=Araneus ventricosus TaxID=182803 RepID=A0A4Y2IGZ1_ARAVE|nr:hypothetical protein AVEN_230132-1 [Araneus ventricosus]